MDNETKDFSIGDYVKIGQRAFMVCKIAEGLTHIPDGFLNDGFDDFNGWVNPKYCEPYKGATSVIILPETI